MVCTGTPEKKEEEKRKTRKRKRKENTQKRRKIKRKKAKWTSAEGAGESLGDKVAVCWYDQSCDGSSWWTNIRTTQKKKERKERKKERKNREKDETRRKTKQEEGTQTTTKRAVLCPAAGPRTTQGTQKEDRDRQAEVCTFYYFHALTFRCCLLYTSDAADE